ncbi:serine hydrolase domain-containing protein [Segetibacter sp.]|jgi:CubicO group peptidase (beta-lactamase class C family)|uniref:serine hydrolase domain-containing protein n=1 Tax=Segetibacter sp. TaxID=2231182 RepID=UPI002620D02C|nr:serine hydrolase domain-containing protein [Segetibacter sp.]MCW3080371.1 estB 1 [Segetibacter sp.]
MKRPSSIFAALLGLFFVFPSLHAQVIQTINKQNSSINYNRLNRIDTLLNDYINKTYLTGAVTLVIKDNQLVQYKGYGYADAETKSPMKNDAIFRIMSQTKAITSVAVMILYEQGKLLLDQPIADFIPEFRNPVVIDKYNSADTTYTTVPAKRNITFRDLLTHSSGIDYADIGSPRGNAIYAKAGIPSGLGYFNADLLAKMKVLGKQPLQFQPGEKWQYGLNTDLLGCLVEIISGTNLENFFQNNIFGPLGMKDTYFNLPQSKANRLASVYTEDSLHRIIKWSQTFRRIDPNYPLMDKKYFSGGAGLSSTALDYAVFMQMLLNGGIYNKHRILSPKSVEMMTSPQLDFLYNNSDNFGLGFGLTSAKSAGRNARSEGSFAWGGYYGTTYWADPKKGLVCLIMTQHTPNSHGDIAAKFEALVYASLNK